MDSSQSGPSAETLFAEWLGRREDGDDSDLDALCARHPGHRPEAAFSTARRSPDDPRTCHGELPAQLRRAKTVGLVAALLVTLPSTAYANSGIPMIAPAWLGMGVVLVPVIAVEFLLLRRVLATTWKRTLWTTTLSNGFSTIVGVPLTWGVLMGVQMVYGMLGIRIDYEVPGMRILDFLPSSAWIIFGDERDLNWMVPVSMLVLLVGFFFVSWCLELWITRQMLPQLDRLVLRRAVMRANLVSNGLLAMIVLWMLIDLTRDNAAV